MMKDQHFISRQAARCFTWAVALLFTVVTGSHAERPPNIIYIMTDDLGYGDLGCYGQKTVRTPNLDRMAAEGMRFTDHYAGHTVCRPSRLVLWTGQHVGHTGLIGNRDRSLTGMESTVAQRLKTAGYATGGVGKWALGNVDDPSEVDNPGHPNNNGFDYWFGYLNQGNAHNFYPPFLWENKKQIVQSGNVLMDDPQARGRVSSKKVTYSHDEMTDAAFKFVRQHRTIRSCCTFTGRSRIRTTKPVAFSVMARKCRTTESTRTRTGRIPRKASLPWFPAWMAMLASCSRF